MKRTLLISLIVVALALLITSYPAIFDKVNDKRNALEPDKIARARIGNTAVDIRIYQGTPSGIVFFNMHDDENTAVEAGKEIVQKYGGRLIELKATGRRLISFALEGQQYTFDPNRIFTETGIKKTLEKYGHYSEAAHQEVQRFVDTLFQHLFLDDLKVMITLHNNSEEEYSLISYLPGGIYERDVSRYSVNPDMDSDDFYFVTDAEDFDLLRAGRQNAVLQDNELVVDDGSLSVYCGRQNIHYINVEAQHGHLRQQMKMLETVMQLFADSSGIARMPRSKS